MALWEARLDGANCLISLLEHEDYTVLNTYVRLLTPLHSATAHQRKQALTTLTYEEINTTSGYY